MTKTIYSFLIILLFSGAFSAQVKDTLPAKKDSAATKAPEKKDAKKVEKIKPYKDVITKKAVTDLGVFDIHKVEDKYYLEIPDKILKKEFLLVSRLTKAAAGMRSGTTGYAGDQISQNVISFEKGPEDKIFLKSISFVDYAKDSTSQMYNSVIRNNVQAIEQAFDIKAFNKEKKSSVIEVTSFFNSDSDLVSFAAK